MKSNFEKMTFKARMATFVGTIGLVWGSIAAAAPPASVTGYWSIIGNQSAGTLYLSQGYATSTCKPINGKIYTNDIVLGYYCPPTGRIAFYRKNSVGVSQAWVGNVSEVVTGQPQRMGGTFHALDMNAGSGLWAEYHFQGYK